MPSSGIARSSSTVIVPSCVAMDRLFDCETASAPRPSLPCGALPVPAPALSRPARGSRSGELREGDAGLGAGSHLLDHGHAGAHLVRPEHHDAARAQGGGVLELLVDPLRLE